VSALKTALRTSQEAFEAGSIPLTDVLDADRQLLSAQDELALVRANSGRAAVASFRSMGGGGATEARLLANSAASQPSGG
jgi:outer membrane protein TolC